MNSAELNYSVSEQELLAMVEAIKTFDYYLRGKKFIAETDHKPLTFIFTQPKLSARQCRWMNLLAGFEFEVKYLEGKKNVVADGLTRMDRLTDLQAKPIYEETVRAVTISSIDLPSLIAKVAYSGDEINKYQSGKSFIRRSGLFLKREEGRKDRICVPSTNTEAIAEILKSLHDEPTAGHLGVTKTCEAVKERFYWKGLQDDVRDFVSSCVICQKVQHSTKKPAGMLQPLTIPDYPWKRINWDFITGFPKTKSGKDAIATYVDALTKMVHFSAVNKDDDVRKAVGDYVATVVRHHGLQSEIVSDRDSRFTSEFHTELCKRLGVKRRLSTAYHPQTDGLAEVSNKVIIKMLRAFCEDQKDDWDEYLPMLEFAYNSSVHSATGQTPFMLNTGRQPSRPIDVELPEQLTKVESLEDYSKRMKFAVESAKVNIKKAQERMVKYKNKNKRELEFSVGNMVLLHAAGVVLPPTPGSNSFKLNEKYLGPFKVLERTSKLNYRLELPPLLKIHDVFHVSKLKEFKASAEKFGQRAVGPFKSEIPEGDQQWEIKKVVGEGLHQTMNRKILHCKWKGFPSSENTWELESYVKKLNPRAVEEWYSQEKAKGKRVATRAFSRKSSNVQRGR